ncbi:hypothetical protein CFC21_061109, partial [Triticum aestivum]
GSS